jgi:hypothetical protein
MKKILIAGAIISATSCANAFGQSLSTAAKPVTESDCRQFQHLAEYVEGCPEFEAKKKSRKENAQSLQYALVTDSLYAYLACAKLQTPIMDDGISDAATIASGLHAQCYGLLSKLSTFLSLEQIQTMASDVKPVVLSYVLEGRAKGKKTPPQPPSPPKQIKPTM